MIPRSNITESQVPSEPNGHSKPRPTPDRQMLTLKRPAPHSTGEPWGNNDYEVHDSEGLIGRIVLTTASFTAGRDRPWFWSITCKVPNEPADRGNAATLEDAMQAFKSRWLVVSENGRPRLP